MTPEQLLALLSLFADLRVQLGQALADNAQLRQQVAALAELHDASASADPDAAAAS